MKKSNLVFCDGGLSNRLNSLIFALILREKYGAHWEISWPQNNWCGSDFSSLFQANMPVHNYPLNYFNKVHYDYTCLIHENQAYFNEGNFYLHSSINSYQEYFDYLQKEKPVFYFHNQIPSFASIEDIRIALDNISVNSELKNIALNFCSDNNITDSVFGLHIRKTDFGNLVDDIALFDLVKNSNNKFFVCSDDELITEKFNDLKNCCSYLKKNYPTQLNINKGWQETIQDDQNRSFNFNITRSAESIKEALIDLLILSSTTHIDTSPSTFLKMSMFFKYENVLHRKV